MKKPALVALLTEACQHPYGVKVKTSDANRLRQKLYPLRKESAAFRNLSFIVPPSDPEHTLFIVRKEIPPDAEE